MTSLSLPFRLLVLLMGLAAASAWAQPSLHEQAQLLGNPLRIQQQAQLSNSGSGTGQTISHETKTQMLGKSVNLLKVDLQTDASTGNPLPTTTTTTTGEGEGAGATENSDGAISLNQHDVFIGGLRVWNGKFRFDKGSLVYSGGIAPTQIGIPLVTYPIGPLLLQVEAGVEFEGLLEARFTIGPSYPLRDSTVNASLQADLYAAAYVEAYAKLLFLKAGLGGRIDVIDSQAGFFSTFFLNGLEPLTTNYGWARLLDGHVYGFLDSKLLFGRWTRYWQRDFFNWQGVCLTFTDGIKSCY